MAVTSNQFLAITWLIFAQSETSFIYSSPTTYIQNVQSLPHANLRAEKHGLLPMNRSNTPPEIINVHNYQAMYYPDGSYAGMHEIVFDFNHGWVVLTNNNWTTFSKRKWCCSSATRQVGGCFKPGGHSYSSCSPDATVVLQIADIQLQLKHKQWMQQRCFRTPKCEKLGRFAPGFMFYRQKTEALFMLQKQLETYFLKINKNVMFLLFK